MGAPANLCGVRLFVLLVLQTDMVRRGSSMVCVRGVVAETYACPKARAGLAVPDIRHEGAAHGVSGAS